MIKPNGPTRLKLSTTLLWLFSIKRHDTMKMEVQYKMELKEHTN